MRNFIAGMKDNLKRRSINSGYVCSYFVSGPKTNLSIALLKNSIFVHLDLEIYPLKKIIDLSDKNKVDRDRFSSYRKRQSPSWKRRGWPF